MEMEVGSSLLQEIQKGQLEDEKIQEKRRMSFPVFMPKPSTHRMHDPGSNVPHIQPKVLTDNQMS
jgi:hypothetical protein